MIKELRLPNAVQEKDDDPPIQIRTPIKLQQAVVAIHQLTINDPLMWAFAVIRGGRLNAEREEAASA